MTDMSVSNSAGPPILIITDATRCAPPAGFVLPSRRTSGEVSCTRELPHPS